MYNSNFSVPSLSDIAAVTNNDGFGGNNGWWILIILFALWGNNGFGNGFINGGGVTDAYVLNSDFATLSRQVDSGFDSLRQQGTAIGNGISSLGYDQLGQFNATNIAMMQGFNTLQSQFAQCCCDSQYRDLQNTNTIGTAIANGFCQSNFNAQTNTRDIVDSQNAGTRVILEKLSQMESDAKDTRIAELTQKISGLELAASQYAQNNYIVDKLSCPKPVPAFPVNPPFPYYGITTVGGTAIA